jgi:hypothetical protein
LILRDHSPLCHALIAQFAAISILVGDVVDTHPDRTGQDECHSSVLIGFFGRNALLFSLLPALFCIPLSYRRRRVGF